MSSLVERLHTAGVRLSAQRRIVAEQLDGEHRHVTADELLEQAQVVLPEIGRATVYKALAAFVEAGVVRVVKIDDGPSLFDPNGHIEHHHLVCETCGRIRDTHIEAPVAAAEDDFVVNRVEMTLLGLCADCRELQPR